MSDEQTLVVGGGTLPRLYLHPDAAGGWLPSGDPVDAGTMHHLSSNLSLLCRESHRHLVADVGPGKMPRHGSAYTGNGWDGAYTDSVNSATTDVDEVLRGIAWDRRTARSYHLPAMIADRKLPGGGWGLRIIEVELDVLVATNSTLQLFAALTPSYQTPDQGALASATWSDWTEARFQGNVDGTNEPDKLQSGRQTVRLWLECRVPAGAAWSQWTARESGTIAGAAAMVYEGHLWVGWRSTDADNVIVSINAWEVPEPLAPLTDVTAATEYYYGVRMDLIGDTTTTNGVEFCTSFGDSFGPGNNYNVADVIYNRSGFGGRPCAQFRKANLSRAPGSFTFVNHQDATFYAVITPRSAPSGGYVPVFECSDLSPTHPSTEGFGIRSQGTEWGAWADDPATGFIGSTLTVGTTYIVCAVIDGTDVYWYVNGIQQGTIARPSASTVARYGPYSGFLDDVMSDVPGAEGDFDLYEGLYYAEAHTVEQRAFVLEYLNRRYGVF